MSDIMKPATTTPPISETAQAPATAQPPASTEALSAIDRKLNTLISRLDTFEGRISSLETGLHEMSSNVSKSGAAPAPSVDVTGLQDGLKSLESRLASLEKHPAPAAIKDADEPAPVAQEPEEPRLVEANPEPAPVKAADPVRSAPPAVTKWILRSAQPGSAMLVPSGGGEMKTVAVGDTLSGIGRIKSIQMEGGRWVVQGTTGKVTN